VSCNGEQRGTDLERVRRVVGSQSRAAALTFDDVRRAGRCGRCRSGGQVDSLPAPATVHDRSRVSECL